MKYILYLLSFILFINFSACSSKKETQALTQEKIKEDLSYLSEALKDQSSYAGLNGYDYQKDINRFIKGFKGDTISKDEFYIFLSNTMGGIGDRHSSVKDHDIPDDLFLPFTFAPFNDGVIIIQYDKPNKIYHLTYPQYPFVKSIGGIEINEFIRSSLPKVKKAPALSQLNRVTERIEHIQEGFQYMGKELPKNEIKIILSGENGDTTIISPIVSRKERTYRWDDKFHVFAGQEKEALNAPEVVEAQFNIDENNIAFMRIPDMVKPDIAPNYYSALKDFMNKAKSTKALIIDIRGNDGGSRHLIFELAKYIVHPDAIHVVNLTRQVGSNPLDEYTEGSMNRRYLFSKDDYNTKEQEAIERFMVSFNPMYELDDNKFTDYYFMLFNGEKLKDEGYHYNQPIYILVNERVFSSASIFASTLKGLPNVTLAGTTIDGSSGNSEYIKLPNSNIRIKISTMVSMQKDGRLFDGYGTEPDIFIPRSLDQVLWKEDYQLERVKDIINSKS